MIDYDHQDYYALGENVVCQFAECGAVDSPIGMCDLATSVGKKQDDLWPIVLQNSQEFIQIEAKYLFKIDRKREIKR